MDNFAIKTLCARRTGSNIDNYTIGCRIKANKLFTSIDECFYFLENVVMNKPFNIDDPTFVSYQKDPVFVVNTIDEVVCTLMSEILIQKSRYDHDFISYIRHKTDEFLKTLVENQFDEDKVYYYKELVQLLNNISYLSSPLNDVEQEAVPKLLSALYYQLMLKLYSKHSDLYFKKFRSFYDAKSRYEVITMTRSLNDGNVL